MVTDFCFRYLSLIPILAAIALYVLGITTLVYLIRALRIYIKKNK